MSKKRDELQEKHRQRLLEFVSRLISDMEELNIEFKFRSVASANELDISTKKVQARAHASLVNDTMCVVGEGFTLTPKDLRRAFNKKLMNVQDKAEEVIYIRSSETEIFDNPFLTRG